MIHGLIDTHAHLSSGELFVQIEQVLERARRNGVGAILCVGTDPDDCRKVQELARRYPFVFSICGISPHDAGAFRDLSALTAILDREKLVAIGETGLDYHYDFAPRNDQRRLFAAHLELARSLHLPVVVHCREAFDDALAVVKSCGAELTGVFHCFTGGRAEARRVIDLGWYISFSGVLTFANCGELKEVASFVPGDRMLVETDSPYLSPAPLRGRRPNEPANVRYVAEKLAEIRRTPLEKLLEQLQANAVTLFGPIIKGAVA